jgi:hypothetical protein
VRVQAQVEHLVGLYKRRSFTSSTPFSDPPFKPKKEKKLRTDCTFIMRYLDHIIRQPGIREYLDVLDLEGGPRLELACNPVVVASLGLFLTVTRGMGVVHSCNPVKRACSTIENYIRCVSPLQLHCYKVLDDECKKLQYQPDSPWKQLAKRLVTVNACTINMANAARSEGLEVKAYTHNEEDAGMRARVDT